MRIIFEAVREAGPDETHLKIYVKPQLSLIGESPRVFMFESCGSFSFSPYLVMKMRQSHIIPETKTQPPACIFFQIYNLVPK